jgi:hypothetical protein
LRLANQAGEDQASAGITGERIHRAFDVGGIFRGNGAVLQTQGWRQAFDCAIKLSIGTILSALPPRADIVQVIPVANSCERGDRGLAGLSVPARGSSAADLTTSYVPSRTPSLETDWVGKSHRGPGPFDSTG